MFLVVGLVAAIFAGGLVVSQNRVDHQGQSPTSEVIQHYSE